MAVHKALTIAGSDSGGGAGIQADLKTFSALGVYGTSVLTSITAQNTQGVHGIYDLPAEMVGKQIDAVMEDIGTDAAKTGMLSNRDIIEVVAERIASHGMKNLVVDPVMVAKGGHPLLEPEAVESLRSKLVPLSFMITPNIEEANALTGLEIGSVDDMKRAAKAIYEAGARNVLVKGGHLSGDPTDVLYDGKDYILFTAHRVATENTHGTGCVLSSAITAYLARGLDVKEAVGAAKTFLIDALRFSFKVGEGINPSHMLHPMERELERYTLIEELQEALEELKRAEVGRLIPEVQSNLGAALRNARGPEDVAAFPGRIVRMGGSIATLAAPRYGASRHVAKVMLTVMKYDPTKRSVMNIRYDPRILEICRQLKFKTGTFSRSEEPPDVKAIEGSSLEWGTNQAIRALGSVPDVIYDEGGLGKEEMIRVIGAGPRDVARKIIEINSRL